MKLEIGNKMPNFTVDTLSKRGAELKSLLSENNTAILFLRYAGCTICQYDMLLLKNDYNKITESGGKVLVVLQSDPDKLQKKLEEGYYPFEIICDPTQAIYKELEIKPAASEAEMIGPDTLEKLGETRKAGITHGEYEGNEMQLPALFVLDRELNVLYARYSKHLTDLPNTDGLRDLLKIRQLV